MTPTPPLYQSERATVWCADSRDVLPTFKKESIDLVAVDVPYGKEWQSNRRSEQFSMLDGDGADEREGVHEILVECVRVTGQNRHLYVFGPDDVLDGLKVTKPVTLIWDKGTPGSGDLAAAWGPQHEPINFVVSKFRHAGEAGKENLPARMRKGSIIRATRPTGRKVRHPSEKPVQLMRELIESSSRIGEVVLDPCAGIGSTGVAAILLGRRALLIESNPDYAAVAVERVKEAERVMDETRWL